MASSVRARPLAARDLGQQAGQGLGAEQAELEVLGAAADGGQDLLRVGGGQHEHDVAGRLLERLQQRVRGGGGQHVHLVDDVDLPPARGAERGVRHQVAHGVDTVVGGGVELVDVEGGPPGDLDARITAPARLTVLDGGAVERLGQDARRGGLAGAARPAEEVGMSHACRRARRCAAPGSRGPGPGPRRSAADGSVGRGTGRRWVAASPASATAAAYRWVLTARSGAGWRPVSVRRPGWLRHTTGPAESCCLPALTRFTGDRCAGPGRRTGHRTTRRRR